MTCHIQAAISGALQKLHSIARRWVAQSVERDHHKPTRFQPLKSEDLLQASRRMLAKWLEEAASVALL